MIDQTFQPRLGAYGAYGGRYSSELLHPALSELARAADELVAHKDFQSDLSKELQSWAGRPTALSEAPRYSELCQLRILLKREDLLHGGAHKTNNAIGQALLAKRLGKRCLIAETGAGQHGVATAMVAARYGLEATIYMGLRDMKRQALNVQTMELLGAEVIPVASGQGTLREAINEALRAWTLRLEDSHYTLGTVCGPDPFPRLVRSFQEVIGREARLQISALIGKRPDAVAACVGGGSNAIGIFSGFLDDSAVALFGLEPGGVGIQAGEHAATLNRGRPGILHGARSYLLQDAEGQTSPVSSLAAGLDYPGVGPEHAALRDSGRVRYLTASNSEALQAFRELSKTEGIIPAFESSHALAFARFAVERGQLDPGSTLLINLSGRGQKDLGSAMAVNQEQAK